MILYGCSNKTHKLRGESKERLSILWNREIRQSFPSQSVRKPACCQDDFLHCDRDQYREEDHTSPEKFPIVERIGPKTKLLGTLLYGQLLSLSNCVSQESSCRRLLNDPPCLNIAISPLVANLLHLKDYQ